MPDISPLDSLQMPPELAMEFFAVFSRFEYAIKDAGFCINRFGRATPDWKRFSEIVMLEVPDNSKLAASLTYLNERPPLIQTGPHEWVPRPLRGKSNVACALDAAQRVRNNLFHGGKHTSHSEEGRDQKLVETSLELLKACAEQHPYVRASYCGGY